MSLYNYTCVLSLLFSLLACGQSKEKDKHTEHKEVQELAGYDINNPVVYRMPKVLNEISGIAFHNGNADTVYAEQDEEGKLFYFQLGSDDIRDVKFGKKGDYEDVQVCNGYIIMLRSDGALFTFPLLHKDKKEAKEVQEFDNLLPAGEYEGMYSDAAANKLYVLCKHCNEKLSITNSGYVFSLDKKGVLQQTENFTISVEDIAAKADIKKLIFEPSALAKNEKANEWFILSSVNKVLVVTSNDWKIKQIIPLKSSFYNQPEGIAFDKDNNLYISNEKGNTASATILKIKYQNQ